MSDPCLWGGNFLHMDDGCFGLDCDSSLYVPVEFEKNSVYRCRVMASNPNTDGRILCFEICAENEQQFAQVSFNCPPNGHVFEIDVTTGNVATPINLAFIKISRTPGSGIVIIEQVDAVKLPRGVGPMPEPRHISAFDKKYCLEQMEDWWEMNSFDQQFWRGRSLVAKRDERGVKCQSMEGEKSVLFVPAKVEPNSVYRLQLDLKRESGNGKLFCNFYANRSFDFPHQPMLCESAAWSTFELQLKTSDFPPNIPIMLRLWRSPGGTGSLLVKRIAFEVLPQDTPVQEPKMIASSSSEPVSAATDSAPEKPQMRLVKRNRPHMTTTAAPIQIHKAELSPIPNNLQYSRFSGHDTKVLVVSELDDEIVTKDAFIANGIRCEGIPVYGNLINLSKIAVERGANIVHFHLGRPTAITTTTINDIRFSIPNVFITAWLSPGWPVFDKNALAVLRAVDLALVESEIELAIYRSAGCFNVELWDAGAVGFNPPDREQKCDAVIFAESSSETYLETIRTHLPNTAYIRLAAHGDTECRSALFDAKSIVFVEGPMRKLFGLMASGVPVIAKRSMEIIEWCEDGHDLLLFDSPEESASLVAQLSADPTKAKKIGDNGAKTALSHSRVLRIKELALRIGCFEAIMPNFPKNRISYTFKRTLCIMRDPPMDLMSKTTLHDMDFLTIPFTECRDLVAKILRFNPDILLLFLDEQADGLPWRDLMLDLRRKLPNMLAIAWHPGGEYVDQRMIDLRFCVDHLTVRYDSFLQPYFSMSLIGTWSWDPGVLPLENPAAFRNAVFDLMRSMNSRRANFLNNANGKPVDLTIFIGTHNRLNQLQQAVDSSLVSSNLHSVEIIVNDAGSNDGTQEWLRKRSGEDKRIIPIFSGKRTSFTQAFNEALAIAKGKYICWLSDDIVPQGAALSDMCLVMDESSPIDMGGFCVKNSWGDVYTVRMDSGIYFPTVGCMYTETLKKFDGINMDYPYYSQDTDLDMRILRTGGRIIACTHCNLMHNCTNDELRRSNGIAHSKLMHDMKYILAAWKPGESSRFPYPTVLLIPVKGCEPNRIIEAALRIRCHFTNSHIFVAGEGSEHLDVHGQNSFLRRVPLTGQRSTSDLVIRVGRAGNSLVRPMERSNTPFVKKLLQG